MTGLGAHERPATAALKPMHCDSVCKRSMMMTPRVS